MANTEQVFDGDELLDLPATALATIIGSNQIICKEEQVVWMLIKCQNKTKWCHRCGLLFRLGFQRVASRGRRCPITTLK